MSAKQITERGILYRGTMVRAILAGTKTQTRRICKPAEAVALSFIVNSGDGTWGDEEGDVIFRCPYGQPGDHLWVRETFWQPRDKSEILFRADGAILGCGKWTPSIHMPRAASRILLEVVSVRVERLQDISEADAIAEGIEKTPSGLWSLYGQAEVDGTYSPRASYRALWESINGAGSWDANPWVWVVEFKQLANSPGRFDKPETQRVALA